MATVSSPYGLRPVGLLGGYPYAGATRMYRITSNYATPIQTGDLVTLTASSGYIGRMNTTRTATTTTTTGSMLGVFMGCSYTDATLGLVFRTTYPGSVVASDIKAFVVDDPNVVFAAQGDAAGTQASIGPNYALIQTVAGSAAGVDNIVSGLSVSMSSGATTAALPVRVIGVNELPGNLITSTAPDVLVIINSHFYKSTTGTAP